MEEQEIEQYPYERFHLSNKAYLEIGWNKSAVRNNVGRLVIEEDDEKIETIISLDDIQNIALYLTKRPDKFMKSKSKTVGIKYQPVPDSLYQKYLDRKKWIEKQKGRNNS